MNAGADYWRRDQQVISENFSSPLMVAELWRCPPGICLGYFFPLQPRHLPLVYIFALAGTIHAAIMEPGRLKSIV